MDKKFKIKNNFINLMFSILTYFSFILYLNIKFYNFVSLIIFIFILLFYFKFNVIPDKKNKRYSLVISIIFSITLALGCVVSKHLSISDIGFLTPIRIVKVILIFIGFLPFFKKLFEYLFLNFNKVNINRSDKLNKIKRKYVLFIFLTILFGWGIMLLRFFPAIMTPDSYYVIHNAAQKILSDHHTFGHTWFFAPFFYIGRFLFKSDNGGVFVYILAQMIIMDLIYTFSIKHLYDKGLKSWICLLITIYIAFNPLYSRYSVTLWRDVLFGMSFVVMFICLYDYLTSNYKITLKKLLLFTLSVIILLFFRNNGIYVFIFMAPFIILVGKNKMIKKTLYCLCIIALYFIIKGSIFDYFNVERGLSSEAYSIPIQQISRVVASNESISKEQAVVLEKLYDIERAKVEYNPIISDRMKETIDNDYLNNNKAIFFKVWFNMLLNHPKLYFEAYFTQTIGYWYPDIEYWATAGEGESFFEENVKTTPLLPQKINNILDKTISRKIPFSIFIWSIGLNVELLVLATILMIYKNGSRYILMYIPFYALWLTMMMASPVYAELRYVFGIFATMPFLILIPFFEKEKNKNLEKE